MQIQGFKEYLQDKDLDSKIIENSLSTLKEFKNFLIKLNKSITKIKYDDLHNFSAFLIENGLNSYENYVSLLRYGYFSNNKELIIASMELLDGSEMINNFERMLIEEFGKEVRNEIFEDKEVPPLGLHPKKKPEITKKLVRRFIMKFGEEISSEFFAIGLRDKYTESYKKPRERFLETNNIDILLFIRIIYSKSI